MESLAIEVFLRARAAILVFTHALAFTLIFAVACLLNGDRSVSHRMPLVFLQMVPIVVALKLCVFIGMENHRGWWRYATFADLTKLVESASIGSSVLVLLTFFCEHLPTFTTLRIPLPILFFDWTGTILALGGLRASTRIFRERFHPMIHKRVRENVLLIGATDANLALIGELHRHPTLNYRVIGLVDDDLKLQGRTLGGIKVVGMPSEIVRIALRRGVGTILATDSCGQRTPLRVIVSRCAEASIKVKVVPPLTSILNGSLTIRPRNVEIHDLLSRPPVCLDGLLIGRLLRGRCVLVTGAAGSIGSELCRQILQFGPERLVLLDQAETPLFFLERELISLSGATKISSRIAGVTDALRLRLIFDELAPAVVFHAAAYKHVPLMECNPGEALKNNVFGTQKLVDECVRAGVDAFVMISSDKAVNPSSVMGVCKRMAEMYVQAMSDVSRTRMVTVRFGNVLGSNGSVVPVFCEQILRGGPITVTHPDMTRYFMTIAEAAQLVLQAGSQGEGGEIFVLDMGQPVRIVDLARDLIRLSGLLEGNDIDIVFTGLRPGEKLHEELYEQGEQQLPTRHPKISIARHRACSLPQLQDDLLRLDRLLDEPISVLLREFKRIVPEYQPYEPSLCRVSSTIAGRLAADRVSEFQPVR